MNRPFDLSLYLVTDRELALGRPLEQVVEEAVKGGVTLVQLREKQASSKEFYELALLLKKCLAPYRVPLIINDRVDIALACDAEGLHIGQHDLPYPVARKLMDKDKIIGLSVESPEDVQEANRWDIDYIGISPIFSTPTKTDTAPALGLEGIRQISALSRHPGVGIGGVHVSNVEEIIEAGANGVAVVSALMSSPEPEATAKEFIHRINQARRNI
ncbi:MAG: thiamine phosphate synthase [Tannerellaceae bacterium]|nr:thiamine phosphate synthase [Tannerellaceae bacterium]